MVTMHTSTFVILIIFLIASAVCNLIQLISYYSTVDALLNSSDADNETVLDAKDAYDQSVKNQLKLVKKRLISRINDAIKDGRSCVVISDSTIYPVCEMPQEVLDYLSKEKHYSIEKLDHDDWTNENEWKISWKPDK
jgi:hypothetical protein